MSTSLDIVQAWILKQLRGYAATNAPLYRTMKEKQLDTAIKNITLKRWMERYIRRTLLTPSDTSILFIAFDYPFLYAYPYLGVVYSDEAGKHYSLHDPNPKNISDIIRDFSAPPLLADNLFMQAFRNALQRETYDAFEQWYNWLLQPEDTHPVIIDYYANDKAEARYKSAIAHLNKAGSDNPSVRMLEKLWITFHSLSWRSTLQYGVVEAAAIALSKYYGSVGNYERALYFVGLALQEPHTSIHLKAASHTLHLRIQGQSVPPRLEKFVGPDNGYLKNFVCDMPFKRFDIVETGEVNVCCGHWLPTSIGNIESDSLDNILNSNRAKAIRKTMTDGTYKYCNHLECVHLAQNVIPPRATLHDPVIDHAIANDDFGVTHVDNMLFSYDQSCNLACPSCRRERIIEKPSQNEEKARIMETKLMPLLSGLKHLEINVAGEVFVSKPSRKILSMISQETCPDLKIDMISNGMLFNETEWKKFPGIHGKVSGVRISIDGARKETFEKLRRFGIHEVLLENLAFLQRLRKEKSIGGLTFSFTYQLDNFREMEEFIHFGRSFGADKIIFEPLQNVGAFTAEEYLERAVHRADHPLFPEFLAMIRRPIFKAVGIQHDFSNYEGFGDTDLFLSQDFVPHPADCRLEGMECHVAGSKNIFFATATTDHHRVMLRDTAVYLGTYNLAVQITPLDIQYIGIEIQSISLSDYGRILFDVQTMKVINAHSILDIISDIEVSPTQNGTIELSFDFTFHNRSGVILNFYIVDSEGRIIHMGNKKSGFALHKIRARKAEYGKRLFQSPEMVLTEPV